MSDLSYAYWSFAQGLTVFHNVPWNSHGITVILRYITVKGYFHGAK